MGAGGGGWQQGGQVQHPQLVSVIRAKKPRIQGDVNLFILGLQFVSFQFLYHESINKTRGFLISLSSHRHANMSHVVMQILVSNWSWAARSWAARRWARIARRWARSAAWLWRTWAGSWAAWILVAAAAHENESCSSKSH